MAQLIDKSALVAEIERIMAEEMSFFKDCCEDELENSSSPAVYTRMEMLLSFLNSLEVKELPKWKKTIHDNGCWSCEIGVNPSKRLYEYEHYTINADKLFKLLDKEE